MRTPLNGSLVALALLALLVACQPDSGHLPTEPETQTPPPPDASRSLLVYSGTVGGNADNLDPVAGNADIYVIKANGTGKLRLTTHTAADAEPVWSPDGSSIAFRSDRDGNSEIYVMNGEFDGSDPLRLTNHPAADYQPAWSPDGSGIAFGSDRDGNAEIYVMAKDGTNPVRLTNDIAADRSPAWSPDGKRIAFSSDRDGNSEIYVMDADGSNLVRLTYDAADDIDPAWSPDGTKLAISRFVPNSGFTTCLTVEDDYRSMCRWDVLIMNADGSDARRLPLPTAPQTLPSGWWRSVFVASDPAWSPDSRRIAVAVFYCLSDFGGADCHSSNPIMLLSANGTSGFVELTGGPGTDYKPVFEFSPAWRPGS